MNAESAAGTNEFPAVQPIHKRAVVVGGGPAGLAAAIALYKHGIRDLAVLEREQHPGGILRQCIHDGFGLTRFGESLSGPEYADRFIGEAAALGIEIRTGVMVTDISSERRITAVGRGGRMLFDADAVVLAMGCRERTRGALAIPGERPAGVFTAGVAQTYINLKNTMVGKNVVILGSGDIGMIMARRLTLEGARVQGVYEILSYPSGLPRNVTQCLDDYDIPLHLSHTVTRINGKARLESAVISRVDECLCPIPGTEEEIPCDTLILSVGLIPENELSLKAGVDLDPRTKGAVVDEHYQTGTPGIFAAGNVLHVHDLVDQVSLEAENLAKSVAAYLESGVLSASPIAVETGEWVGYTVPQRISGAKDVPFLLRVRKPLKNGTIEIWQDGRILVKKRFKKAIPACMEQVLLPHDRLLSKNNIKVVANGE